MLTFEIYFSDLTDEAQKELVSLVGEETAKFMRWDEDIIPLTVFNFYPEFALENDEEEGNQDGIL